MHMNWEILRLVLIQLLWTVSLVQDMYKTARPRIITGFPLSLLQHKKSQELLCNLPADPNQEKEVEVNRQLSRLSNVLVLPDF